jgi:hypothetical protein
VLPESEPDWLVTQGGHNLAKEHVLGKNDRGGVIAGVEGDAAFATDSLIKGQGDALLLIKP